MFTVLDVSRWQGRIDWDTVKASGRVHGVMLRALGSRSGTPYIDPMFETNYSACTRLGIPVGVYYYSCAVTAPQRDAELALLHDALRGKRLQLPAAIDVEDARLRALTPDALSALVAGAARQLEHWGLYAMVYTYTHLQILPCTWTRWPPSTSGWRTTGANARPAGTECGSTPAGAGCPASPAPWT